MRLQMVVSIAVTLVIGSDAFRPIPTQNRGLKWGGIDYDIQKLRATTSLLSSKDRRSDDEEIMIDEKQLRDFWKNNGGSDSNFDEDAALQQMAFADFMSDDDDDDDDDDDFELAYDNEDDSEEVDMEVHLEADDDDEDDSLDAVNKKVASKAATSMPTASDIPSGRSVGIDLGTTYSAVSIIEAGMPVIIPIRGSRITPSIVGFSADQSIITGEAARRQLIKNPENTFASVKRIIGRTVKDVKKAGEKLSVHKMDKKKAAAELVCPNLRRNILPEEISAEILRDLIRETSAYLGGEEITKAVITVPAYFLPNQCEATIRAGELAGLKKIKLLREPEAAALAYGLTQKQRQIVLVFDLGGGTFDVSVLEVCIGGAMLSNIYYTISSTAWS
jgi:hypothetical protein